MLNAGDLRTRGVLQERVNTGDGQGGQLVTWTPVATLWAGIVPFVGTEQYAADAQRPMVTHDITIRFRPGVQGSPYGADAAMRFVVGPRIFDIRTVTDTDETHEALVLNCELYAP